MKSAETNIPHQTSLYKIMTCEEEPLKIIPRGYTWKLVCHFEYKFRRCLKKFPQFHNLHISKNTHYNNIEKVPSAAQHGIYSCQI